MKKFLLPAIVIVLAVVAFWVSKTKGDTSTLNEGTSDFAIADTSKVSKIHIISKVEGEAVLERVSGRDWMVNEKYYARPDAIALLLKTFARITVKSPVNEATTATVVKNLAAGGTRVDIYTGGSEPEKTYHMGLSAHDQLGTYMILEQDGEMAKEAYVMHIEGFNGYLTTRFFIQEHLWRDRTVFNYPAEEIKQITLDNFEKPDQSFIVSQTIGGGYTLTDLNDNKYETPQEALANYAGRFKNIHWEVMDTEIEKPQKDSILGTPGFYKMTVETFGGDKIEIHTHRLANQVGKVDLDGNEYPYDLDRMHALFNNEDFVFVQYATFDKLYKELKSFIPPQKPS